ncbi:MAG: aminoacyl-tRNA hydrolase [Cellvibrionaceae bacterium]|nr:aminoacyl-tRNA hydrolase [Cellvibrionaceae bacterium]
MKQAVQLIVGLGNPGSDYQHTRHNAGADLVSAFAAQHNTPLTAENKFFGLTATLTLASHRLHLLIPTTFMNLSGKAVAAIAHFYKIEIDNILLVHDELDLPAGVARFKIGGGHGGHNGLRDSIKQLGNNKHFARLRIGIGHPGDAKQVSHYVLKKASAQDQQLIDTSVDHALSALPLAIAGNWNQAMQYLHSKT